MIVMKRGVAFTAMVWQPFRDPKTTSIVYQIMRTAKNRAHHRYLIRLRIVICLTARKMLVLVSSKRSEGTNAFHPICTFFHTKE